MIQQILINGVMLSSIYALLALGFSLIYGAARIINLTHTAFFMIAAYFMFMFLTLHKLNLLLSIILTIGATTAVGMLFYKLFIDRIREHEDAVFMITVALGLVLQQLALWAFGAEFRGVANFMEGYHEILGVRVSNQQVLALVVVVACIGLITAFLYRTSLGLSIRVTAQDREVANLLGINVGRMCLIAVAIATILSAVAGVMVAPIYIIEPRMWVDPMVIVLAVVILGGLGSIKGSIIGALILGLAESSIVILLPQGSFLKATFALGIMLMVLLIRPEGLFGVVFEEERL